MKLPDRRILAGLAVAMSSLLLLRSSSRGAQEEAGNLARRYYIQAQAMGEGTQLGKTFGVTVIVEQYSSPEDQQALIRAFRQRGNEGLVNALSRMSTKGRISITGTLGYDVSYIREFQMPDGSRKVRLITNRPIRFGENYWDTRSMDYNLSAMEVILNDRGSKSAGTLYPACQLKMDKENQVELELLQNPWRLVDVMVRY
jgi:hypothetical protein